jgi:hypothetical protein
LKVVDGVGECGGVAKVEIFHRVTVL